MLTGYKNLIVLDSHVVVQHVFMDGIKIAYFTTEDKKAVTFLVGHDNLINLKLLLPKGRIFIFVVCGDLEAAAEVVHVTRVAKTSILRNDFLVFMLIVEGFKMIEVGVVLIFVHDILEQKN